MNKTYALAALLLISINLGAQNIETNNTSEDYYSNEIGFFQKAYRDKSDPRFMFKDGNFELGIGGKIQTSMFYDVAGALNDYDFRTAYISIPSDFTPSFGVMARGSQVYFKARAKIGSHKLLAFAKIVSGADDVSKFDQAYISFDGFTIGKTYSFFSDLEAGPRSVDGGGVNSEISNVHTLVGYTLKFGDHMTLGAAVERAELNLDAYAEYGIDTDYQSTPDIALRLKYKGSAGHVQASALLRNMAYWVHEPSETSCISGETRYLFAWGAALSGNWTPSARLRFSAQACAGRGVASYIRDLAKVGLSLAMNEEFQGDYPILRPRFAAGTFATAQYKWSESLSSNLTAGYTYVGLDQHTYIGSDIKNTFYASANLFYDISNFCFVGMEYLHGSSTLYPQDDGGASYGQANRLVLLFAYSF